jgi:uncharacterized membrane protein HdeD (DUF308 family)
MDIVQKQLATILSRAWWVILLRGLIAIAFSILAWTRPGISLVTLVWIFGLYTMADGILGVGSAIAGREEHEHWVVLLLGGLISIGIGVLTFVAPGITALALLFYIAIWAIATGLLQIVAAIRVRKEIQGEWFLVLGGLVSVIFGVFLMSRPGAGALALLWVIAAYASVFGVLLVILALRARTFGKQLAAS